MWAVAFLLDSGLLPKSKRELVSKLQIRWWNYINDEGESTWVFESRAKEDQHRLSTTEVSFFHPSNPGLDILQGVNILGGSRCCPCILDSLLFHCNLLPKAQMACVGGEYFISIQYFEEILIRSLRLSDSLSPCPTSWATSDVALAELNPLQPWFQGWPISIFR